MPFLERGYAPDLRTFNPYDLKLQRLETAQSLEQRLNAEVVGICGHMTGNGAKEYAVYRDKETGSHFIIYARNSRANPESLAAGLIKKGNFVLQLIDTQSVFEQKMKTIEEWLGNK